MKIKILTLLIICLSFYGCGRKCDGYAPEGSEISWTDYNSVRDVHGYFMYRNTAAQHRNDTVLMCGYILGSNDTDYYRNEYYNDIDEGYPEVVVEIIDDPNLRYGNGVAMGGIIRIEMIGTIEQMKWLLTYKAGQKVFVKGFCFADDPIDDSGCICINKFILAQISIKQ